MYGNDNLSKREIEIVKLVADGLTNKEISARLEINPKTVEHHLNSVYSKLYLTDSPIYHMRTKLAVMWATSQEKEWDNLGNILKNIVVYQG